MIKKSDIQALTPHKTLSNSLWEKGVLNDLIRQKLLKIAHDFYIALDVDAQILDITITGSLANYNYTSMSDIDLHIIVDYRKIDENIALVEKYLSAKKTVWNEKHSIKIKNHDVELYAQNAAEPHHSTGVYSILSDGWIKKPKHGGVRINIDAAKKKAGSLIKQIDSILIDKNRMPKIEKMKEKIRNMRQSGLERAGEYSSENLAFKLLRRTGYIEKLYTAYIEDYDLNMSLNESRWNII